MYTNLVETHRFYKVPSEKIMSRKIIYKNLRLVIPFNSIHIFLSDETM